MRCLLFVPLYSHSVGRKRSNCEADPLVRHCSTKVEPTSQSGFTLIELLIVITLLGIVSGVVVLAYQNVQDQGSYDATRFEMAEIKKALLQFRRDSGTKSFPGQGIYDCGDPNNAGALNPALINIPVADYEWCKHPANFWMLFVNPLGADNEWNFDTKRGWNGPYLQRKSGYLDIDADYEMGGTLAIESNTLIDDVWAVASPYIAERDDLTGDLTWQAKVGGQVYKEYGTPYLMFDLADDDENNSDSEARLVSMGKDDGYTEFDSPNCEQQLDNEDNPLDHILCLLR